MVIGIVVVLLLIGGGIYMVTSDTTPATSTNGEAMMEKEEGDAMMEEDDSMMMKVEGDLEMSGETSFRGAVIAGSSSPLLEFNQRDYETALAHNRVVVLYFYASWCPICREEFEHTKEAFDSLTHENVVGFRVHFNDSEVTPPMEALAREFGVAYQHTKVFVKNGERVLKSPETWNTARYLEEFATHSE